jgi:hypothetical protein
MIFPDNNFNYEACCGALCVFFLPLFSSSTSNISSNYFAVCKTFDAIINQHINHHRDSSKYKSQRHVFISLISGRVWSVSNQSAICECAICLFLQMCILWWRLFMLVGFWCRIEVENTLEKTHWSLERISSNSWMWMHSNGKHYDVSLKFV